MTMFILVLFTVFQGIFSSKGQPMSPYCMNIPPRESDALHPMILPGTLGCQNLALRPLVNPLLPIPCEVAHTYIPKPHWIERRKQGKLKMTTIQKIPMVPCVEELEPKGIIGSSITHRPGEWGAAEFGNTALESDICNINHQNITTHDPTVNSSATATGNGTALQKPQTLYCENGNITSFSAVKPECLPPSLVALDCLANLQAAQPLNSTVVKGKICMKKSDYRSGPIDYMTVEATIFKNSSCSLINTELTRDQMGTLENCLANDNDPEPYLVNGHPLILKLQYLNQTEKHHNVTKKIGHDFLIAIPHEAQLGKHEHTPDDTSDNQLSIINHDFTDNSTYKPKDDWLTLFEKTITSTGKINVKETETRQESKVVNQTSNDLPDTNNPPTKSINEDSVEDWTLYEEFDDHPKENVHQLLTRQMPREQVSYYGTLNSPTLLPMNQYYSKPNTVYIPAADHLPRFPSLNHEYPEQEPVMETKPYPAQPAPFLCERQIQGASEVMSDPNNDCPTFIETLEHSTRLNPTVRQTSPKMKLNSAALLYKPHKKRNNELKYEKCRRIESLEQLNGIQSRHETNACWESQVSSESFRNNPELQESLYSNPDTANWQENYYPQELQVQPPNYVMSQNSEQWRTPPTILQPSLAPCSRQMGLY